MLVLFVQDFNDNNVNPDKASVSAPASSYFYLCSLCDGKVLVHDVGTLAVLVELPVSSVALFALDQKSKGSLNIAITQKGKKKISIYSFPMSSSTNGPATLVKEVAVPDSVLALSYCGDWLIVGYKREYTLLSVTYGEVRDVPVPLEGEKPLSARHLFYLHFLQPLNSFCLSSFNFVLFR